jgi:hypothetical protein
VVTIIALPWVLLALPRLFPEMALVWILIDAIYHWPMTAFLDGPFATKTEIGRVPTVYARTLASGLYCALIISIWWLTVARREEI